MSRSSHPPTLLTTLRRTLLEECRVEPGQHLLIAVSGGSDSTALLHALARLSHGLELRVSAHAVDHGLRAEAASELDSVGALAQRLGVPFSSSRLELARGGNLQARARAARYATLRAAQVAVRADYLATAHQAEDRAETVLMRVLRGAGARGLAVLEPRSGDLLRPLIRVRKRAVLAHLTRHGLGYARDPSNEDPKFLRTRIRSELLPLLESMDPAIVAHLNALADGLAAGDPPQIFDEEGKNVPLSRPQVSALRRALSRQSRAEIWLSGGRSLRIDGKTGRYALAPVGAESADSGGAATNPKSRLGRLSVYRHATKA